MPARVRRRHVSCTFFVGRLAKLQKKQREGMQREQTGVPTSTEFAPVRSTGTSTHVRGMLRRALATPPPPLPDNQPRDETGPLWLLPCPLPGPSFCPVEWKPASRYRHPILRFRRGETDLRLIDLRLAVEVARHHQLGNRFPEPKATPSCSPNAASPCRGATGHESARRNPRLRTVRARGTRSGATSP